jgi:Flp pilus assembly protein TadD
MAYAHYGLGVSLARRDRHQEAATAFRKAIALGGANAPTYTQLSLSLQALGEVQAAEEALQMARKLDSARPESPRVQQERDSGE